MSDYKQLPLQFPPETITIPLSKMGRRAGKYVAMVSLEDADLADFNWSVTSTRNRHIYAHRRVTINNQQRQAKLHRVVMGRKLGRELLPSEQVDHIDTDSLNCTRLNLRLVTPTQNNQNQGKPRNNKSGYKGVSWHKHTKKWHAQLSVNRKIISLGYYDSPELAYQVACDAREKYHDEYANHGKSDKS